MRPSILVGLVDASDWSYSEVSVTVWRSPVVGRLFSYMHLLVDVSLVPSPNLLVVLPTMALLVRASFF